MQTQTPEEQKYLDQEPSRAAVERLRNHATRMRMDSIRATTTAGSGHVTSSCSAADIVSTLFFEVMRYDPRDPGKAGSDRFVLSKGHAAPVLYAAFSEAGMIDKKDVETLRNFDSNLEGHPTPRFPAVDVATGALGQGLSAAAGMAFTEKHVELTPARVYALLGDGETAEGAIWEAAEFASRHGLDNLCAIVDANRLAQTGPTMFGHDLKQHEQRWAAFGWHTIRVDGHSIEALLFAFAQASAEPDRPTVIIARTVKGKGIEEVEDKLGKHGKPLDDDTARKALDRLEKSLIEGTEADKPKPVPPVPVPQTPPAGPVSLPAPDYERGQDLATRDAFGDGLTALAREDPTVFALDGDVSDSTRLRTFAEAHPERFLQCYIAEQNMVGVAAGLSACGKRPVAASFGAFLTRAHDFIRMAAISRANITLVGSHAGVSIGKDGPSQMALEDLSMMLTQPEAVVAYPCDAVSAYKLTAEVVVHEGMSYLRTTRGKTPVIYGPDEAFPLGGCKVLRQSSDDRATLVAAGITVHEALAAYDLLQKEGISVRVIDLYSVRPLDAETLRNSARATAGCVFTVEDHYAHGGLGDAVASALADMPTRVEKLAVRDVPRSGDPETLLEAYGIGRRAIADAVLASPCVAESTTEFGARQGTRPD